MSKNTLTKMVVRWSIAICLGLSVQGRMPLYTKMNVKALVDNIPS